MNKVDQKKSLETSRIFYSQLAAAGYAPVFHERDDHMRAICSEGFFMSEYRRIDQPQCRAIISWITKGSAQSKDFLQVRFDTAPINETKSIRNLPRLILVAMFRTASQNSSPNKLVPISAAVEHFNTTGNFYGQPEIHPVHSKLTKAFFNDGERNRENEDTKNRATFFICADKMSSSNVTMRAFMNGPNLRHEKTRLENGKLDLGAMARNTVVTLSQKRVVFLDISASTVTVHAEPLSSYDKTPVTANQVFRINNFIEKRHGIVADHVAGNVPHAKKPKASHAPK